MAKANFTIGMEIQDLFVDRVKITRMVDRDNRRRLGKIGAYIRNRVRRYKLRRSKRTSQPGQPPKVKSREKNATLKNVLFGVDLTDLSVIVGPVALKSRPRDSNRGSVPELLEFGGHQRVFYRGKQIVARYEPRPFMAPALDDEREKGTLQGVFAE